MSFWRQLAQERELRGVSLAEVAERTKISRGTLERMESGEPTHMPPRVYLLGYLRSYAEAVGLDAEDVVLRFEEESLRDEDAPETVTESEGKRQVPMVVWVVLGLGLAIGGALLITFAP